MTVSRRSLVAALAGAVAAPAAAAARPSGDDLYPEVRVELIAGRIRQFVYDDEAWVEVAVTAADPYPTVQDIVARRAAAARA